MRPRAGPSIPKTHWRQHAEQADTVADQRRAAFWRALTAPGQHCCRKRRTTSQAPCSPNADCPMREFSDDPCVKCGDALRLKWVSWRRLAMTASLPGWCQFRWLQRSRGDPLSDCGEGALRACTVLNRICFCLIRKRRSRSSDHGRKPRRRCRRSTVAWEGAQTCTDRGLGARRACQKQRAVNKLQSGSAFLRRMHPWRSPAGRCPASP